MEREESLRRFSASRRGLLEAIAGLSEAELTEPNVEGYWCIKDLIGHISAWDQTLLEPLESFAGGDPFSAEIISNHDAWNLSQNTRRNQWTFSDLCQECETTRQKLLTVLSKLTDEQWQQSFRAPWGDENTISEMVSGLAWHEEEHTKSILKFRSQK